MNMNNTWGGGEHQKRFHCFNYVRKTNHHWHWGINLEESAPNVLDVCNQR